MLNSESLALSHVGGHCQSEKSSQHTILSRKQWFKNVKWHVLVNICVESH